MCCDIEIIVLYVKRIFAKIYLVLLCTVMPCYLHKKAFAREISQFFGL